MITIEQTLPLLVFLIVAFLAFYFVETIILFTLNNLIRRYWKFVVDRLLRAVVHYRNMMRIAAFGVIALITVLLFIFTSLADLLVAGMGVLRFLALILLTTMLSIYYIGSKSMQEVVIAKRIHLFIFIILSLFAFTGIMSSAQNGYAMYEEAINKAFMEPIVSDIEGKYEKRLEDRLLAIFRDDIKRDKCEYYDYANKTGSGLTQFVFIKQDPALAEENPRIRPKGQPLAGKNCIHETKFLLTPEGKWYEVLEQEFY
ncbi:hypothetical protein KJ657_04095 [Patescibacteria group bacterium]|nr:hypothetical protein [Patescibacteria group bacterium]MBU1016246.1 hypothetical protein [Patescibacteria group bacterium]MBU1685478.1 hypothetical protein [Patescibacteria group bacterium]MBU1939104.1 hypothetical protein [Patescibacteria group bacterium]